MYTVTCIIPAILFKLRNFLYGRERECCKIILWKTKFSIICTMRRHLLVMKNYLELKYYTCLMQTAVMSVITMMMRSITCSHKFKQCRTEKNFQQKIFMSRLISVSLFTLGFLIQTMNCFANHKNLLHFAHFKSVKIHSSQSFIAFHQQSIA